MSAKSKSNGQLARAATTLAIGVAGLAVVRMIVQNLAMFQEAGWIVKGKLTVMAGALMLVDAMLLSVLIGFGIKLRTFLIDRFAQIPGLGTISASLVFLIAAGVAFPDFKPLTLAWPSIKPIYLWAFFVLAAGLLVQIVFLLYQNTDRMAALVLHQPLPSSPVEE